MSEMLEKVAAALHDENRCGDEPTYAEDAADVDNYFAQERVNRARQKARAAVEALREPSEGMERAGLIGLVTEIERLGKDCRPTREQLEGSAPWPEEDKRVHLLHVGAMIRCGTEVRETFTAMIDHVLKES